MKKPQWITVAVAIILVVVIYSFGNVIPPKKNLAQSENQHSDGDGHDHGPVATISTDSLLDAAKKKLLPDQSIRLENLETTLINSTDKTQQLRDYHRLSHFWKDTARVFVPFAWYEAEAARLENSEKTLTFAAHLFLGNLQEESDLGLRRWKAMQAKDLFERSLKLNPDNDSLKVGLGACYIFGDISAFPMEGIQKIMEVVNKDSSNLYAQMMLVSGALKSEQYDKAISRLEIVNRIKPGDPELMLLLADLYERTGDRNNAIAWYEKIIPIVPNPDAKKAIESRIAELKK